MQRFDARIGGAIEFHLANVGANLRAIGTGVHAQRPTDCAGNPNQALHATEVMFGAKRNRAAEVGGRINVRETAL